MKKWQRKEDEINSWNAQNKGLGHKHSRNWKGYRSHFRGNFSPWLVLSVNITFFHSYSATLQPEENREYYPRKLPSHLRDNFNIQKIYSWPVVYLKPTLKNNLKRKKKKRKSNRQKTKYNVSSIWAHKTLLLKSCPLTFNLLVFR